MPDQCKTGAALLLVVCLPEWFQYQGADVRQECVGKIKLFFNYNHLPCQAVSRSQAA